MEEKFGSFDWIVDYHQLKAYVNCGVGARALVIGCGTSSVSQQLLGDGFSLIVSIDNDKGMQYFTVFHFNN